MSWDNERDKINDRIEAVPNARAKVWLTHLAAFAVGVFAGAMFF